MSKGHMEALAALKAARSTTRRVTHSVTQGKPHRTSAVAHGTACPACGHVAPQTAADKQKAYRNRKKAKA